MKKKDVLVQRRGTRVASEISTVDPTVVVIGHCKSLDTMRVPGTEAVELGAPLKGLKAEWTSK
jgi:hypothetical protein